MPDDRCGKDRWRSIYRGEDEGHFTIDEINDATGDFTGKFEEMDGQTTVDIKGRCSPEVFWFVRPAENPEYFYWAVFTDIPDPITVEGDRLPLAGHLLNLLQDNAERGGKIILEPGDWVSEKGK